MLAVLISSSEKTRSGTVFVYSTVSVFNNISILPVAKVFLYLVMGPWYLNCVRLYVSICMSAIVQLCVCRTYTECPRCLDPFYIKVYYMNWVKISWTDSTLLQRNGLTHPCAHRSDTRHHPLR